MVVPWGSLAPCCLQRKRKRQSAQRAKEREAACDKQEMGLGKRAAAGAAATNSTKLRKMPIKPEASKIHLTVCWLGASFCGWQDQAADDLPRFSACMCVLAQACLLV